MPVTDVALASEMRQSVMRLARRMRRERLSTDLTLTQLSALGAIERHGPLTPGELADHERVRPPSMTRTLAALEGLGLVGRTPHPTDRRQALVALTPAARDMLREDRRRRDAWLARRLRELPAADREALRRAAPVLERLSRA